MRVLHVTDTFLPRVGGIELHVSDLATRQQGAGHQVHVLTAERCPSKAGAAIVGAPVADGVALERLSARSGLGIGTALRHLMADIAPDVIHAHLTVGSPFTWAVLRNTNNVPAVASVHSMLPASAGLVRAGLRVTGIRTERLVFTAVSEVAAARLRPALGPGQQVSVLHNGIDPGAWRVEHRPTGMFNILAVGRLAARKRPLVLVDALVRFAARAPELDWSATIVGDGPQHAKVKQAIRARGLAERVHLTGALSRTEVRDLLGRTDAFVAPATLESFGIAALEARCAGVPVVGMAASGVTEFVINGVDGLLAETDADLAASLARLATEPELGRRIRAHNTSVSVPMGWEAVLARHEDLYRLAIAAAAQRLATPVESGRHLVAVSRSDDHDEPAFTQGQGGNPGRGFRVRGGRFRVAPTA